MFDIEIRFTLDQAVTLLRVLAGARQSATSVEARDDLELLHGQIYDRVYRTPALSVGVAVEARPHAGPALVLVHGYGRREQAIRQNAGVMACAA